MAFYFVTGKLGNGKTLSCVGRIRDKLRAGCTVATNIDIDLVAMFGSRTDKPRVIRVPDKPTVEDLQKIGNANSTYDESKNGLLVLDECGTWFNSRNWQDKSRQAVNNWMLHARKLGWDVLLIVQDISIVDSQARDALSEHTVFCKRVDNIAIPFIGTLYKSLTGSKLKLPRIHMARVVYGSTPDAMLSDRWVYRGNDLFACYDTKQAFLADYPHGVYSQLTPWHLKGRFQRPRDKEFYMRMTKIMWKRFKSPVAMAVGVLLGISIAATAAFASVYHDLKKERATVAQLPKKEVEPPKKSPDFLEGAKLWIASNLNDGKNFDFRFRVVRDGNASTLGKDELQKIGYRVFAVDECLAILIGHEQRRYVQCNANIDMPQAVPSTEKSAPATL